MGVVEETRQALQDFLAPELRSIDARLGALEKRMDGFDKRMDGLDKRMDGFDKRMVGFDAKLDRNHSELMGAIHRVENYTAVLERLARLEAKIQSAA